MNTVQKVILSIFAVLILISCTFLFQLMSDAFEKTKTYEAQFQVSGYTRYIRTGGVSITLKNEATNEKIEASVPDDCHYQPINKIITATIHETSKEFFGLFDIKFNTIVSGNVCM